MLGKYALVDNEELRSQEKQYDVEKDNESFEIC